MGIKVNRGRKVYLQLPIGFALGVVAASLYWTNFNAHDTKTAAMLERVTAQISQMNTMESDHGKILLTLQKALASADETLLPKTESVAQKCPACPATAAAPAASNWAHFESRRYWTTGLFSRAVSNMCM